MVAPAHVREDAAARAELDRWEALGAAVMSGTYGRKDSWPSDWPRLPHAEASEATRTSVTRGRRNLAVRLGETVDGRWLAHLDFDGKCPCGSDRADHEHGQGACCSSKCQLKNGCACAAYTGIAPEVGLAAALAVLPSNVCIIKTGRGYHVLFLSVRCIPEAVLPELGAEVAAHAGRLSIIPPSLHPSGDEYVYAQPPGADLPIVDLDALGLVPQPKTTRTRSARPAASNAPTQPPKPASAQFMAFFAWLFAGLGLYEGQGDRRDSRGEFFVCPWHADTKASLHVLWASAVFSCQGCGRDGGVRELRALVGEDSASPRKLPNDDSDIPFGNRVTYGGADSLVERIASLADQLPPATLNVTGQQLRDCRQHVLTYQCDGGHEFAPRDERGNPTPLSCDASAGICVRCGPRRFLLDARDADTQLPERVHIFRLVARTPGRELFDHGLSSRLTGRLKTYRKAHGLTAGSAARSLHLDPEGSAFRGHFIVAVPHADAALVVSDGAFSVDDLGECSLEEWHQLQIAEQTAALACLETPEQLEAFYRAMHGQQQFRHFGAWYGSRTIDTETGEVVAPKNAGGAGSSRGSRAPSQVICPLHPGAQVRRSPTPALGSSLVRGDGGVLVPRSFEQAQAFTGGGR